jgi:hypothetical protein
MAKFISTPIEPPRRFMVGQAVTYRSQAECGSQYHYGGYDQADYVGVIEKYNEYIPEKGCYKIRVSCKEGGSYAMLESELREYDSGYNIPYVGRIGVGVAVPDPVAFTTSNPPQPTNRRNKLPVLNFKN